MQELYWFSNSYDGVEMAKPDPTRQQLNLQTP